MQRKSFFTKSIFVLVLFISFSFLSIPVSAATVLKKGSESSAVTELQKDLKALGFFSVSPTGYFGDLTRKAVITFQAKYGLEQDGIAGYITLSKIDKLLDKGTASISGETTQRSQDSRSEYLVSWFGDAENIFDRGDVAEIYDIDTGLSFKAKRTYGTNHADCEPLTEADTAIMKKIYGGELNWDRRAVIVKVHERKIAASMAGMLHAGNDDAAEGEYTSWRSGGYGGGTNLDAVKDNGASGHFDIHFLGSRTHGTNKVNAKHQSEVKRAARWAEKNY